MMEIVFINPFFPPWVPGGAEHSLEQMCINFQLYGWKVNVIAAAFDNREIDEIRSGYSIKWVRAPLDICHGQNVDAEQYLRTKKFRSALLNRLKCLSKPDIVILNNAQVFDVAEIIKEKFKIPIVGIIRDIQCFCEFGTCMDNVQAHEARPCCGYGGAAMCSFRFRRKRGERGWRPLFAWMWYGIQMHRRRMIRRSAIGKFDHVITISEALRTLLRGNMPRVVDSCVSTIRNFPTSGEPAAISEVSDFLRNYNLRPGRYFLFAGKKSYGKGEDILAEATFLIKDIVPDFHTLMLGKGEVSSKFRSTCIVDVASIPQNLLLGVLKECVALVIPGRWQEGLHRTMIDAIRYGIPVICSNAGAPPVDGVIDGRNGIIVPCQNVSALANAMVDVLNWNEAQRQTCRNASRKIFFQRFSNEVIMKQWSDVLSEYACKKLI